jgi:hypothetical protein
MTSQTTFEAIPQPPELSLLGNLFDLRAEAPIPKLMKLSRQYASATAV